MSPLFISPGAGVLVGLIYALLGLFGMQVGEHTVPLFKRLINRQPVNLHWFRHEYTHKIGDTPPPSGDKNP